MKPLFICIGYNVKQKQIIFLSVAKTKDEALQKGSERTNDPYAAFNITHSKVRGQISIWLNNQGISNVEETVNDLFYELINRIGRIQ